MEIPQELIIELQEALSEIALLGALHVEVELFAPISGGEGLDKMAWAFHVEEKERGIIRYARKAYYTSDPLSWVLASAALLNDLAMVIVPRIPDGWEFRCLTHQVMTDKILGFTRRQLRKVGLDKI